MLKKLQEVVDQIRALRITAKSRKRPVNLTRLKRVRYLKPERGQLTRRNGYKLLRIWNEKRCGWLPRLTS